jgi:hypothetical protein
MNSVGILTLIFFKKIDVYSKYGYVSRLKDLENKILKKVCLKNSNEQNKYKFVLS